MTSTSTGVRLYELVGEYAGLGDHRTGTAVDAATSEWFAAELERRGAVVGTHPYEFDAFTAAAVVTVDGREIDTLPLYYSAVGSLVSDAPKIAELEFLGGMLPGDVDAAVIAATKSAGAGGETVVVVATRGHGDRLVALNRSPEGGDGTPAVLVAGGDLVALRTGPVHVEWEASITSATSRNVMGRFGPAGADPVLIATPLSGWFACAGERGSGIAVALHTAAELAADHPVVVVGTTGHELEYLGQRRLIPTIAVQVEHPRAVVHLGAGVGAGEPDGDGTLVPSELRLAMVAGIDELAEGTAGSLTEALGPAGYDVGPGPESWPGEGEALRALGAPTLSLISGFERVHTRDDILKNATSPELLDQVSAGVLAAMRRLVE